MKPLKVEWGVRSYSSIQNMMVFTGCTRAAECEEVCRRLVLYWQQCIEWLCHVLPSCVVISCPTFMTKLQMKLRICTFGFDLDNSSKIFPYVAFIANVIIQTDCTNVHEVCNSHITVENRDPSTKSVGTVRTRPSAYLNNNGGCEKSIYCFMWGFFCAISAHFRSQYKYGLGITIKINFTGILISITCQINITFMAFRVLQSTFDLLPQKSFL